MFFDYTQPIIFSYIPFSSLCPLLPPSFMSFVTGGGGGGGSVYVLCMLTRSGVAQAGVKFTMKPRLTINF